MQFFDILALKYENTKILLVANWTSFALRRILYFDPFERLDLQYDNNFSKLLSKTSCIKKVSFQIFFFFFFFWQTWHFEKFKPADFNYDNSFLQISSGMNPNKAISSQIYLFKLIWNFAFWEIWACNIQVWQNFFKFHPESYQSRQLLCLISISSFNMKIYILTILSVLISNTATVFSSFNSKVLK